MATCVFGPPTPRRRHTYIHAPAPRFNHLTTPIATPQPTTNPTSNSKAWLALKYPSLDLPAREFLFLLTNLSAYVMSSSFFIRESTLAGESRRGAGPPGRRPA